VLTLAAHQLKLPHSNFFWHVSKSSEVTLDITGKNCAVSPLIIMVGKCDTSCIQLTLKLGTPANSTKRKKKYEQESALEILIG
jgi:hypothetical protein